MYPTLSLHVHVSRILKYLVLADLVVLGGWGLINPIAGVFVTKYVVGGTLATLGIVTALFWFVRASLELPVALYLDSREGEQSGFRIMVVGLLIVAAASFTLIFARELWQVYIAQLLHAVGFSLYVPAWAGVFTRHLDSGHTSFDWSLDKVAGSFAAGVSGLLGGVIASAFGFSTVFALATVLSLLAAIILLFAPQLVLPRASRRDPRRETPHVMRTEMPNK